MVDLFVSFSFHMNNNKLGDLVYHEPDLHSLVQPDIYYTGYLVFSDPVYWIRLGVKVFQFQDEKGPGGPLLTMMGGFLI